MVPMIQDSGFMSHENAQLFRDQNILQPLECFNCLSKGNIYRGFHLNSSFYCVGNVEENNPLCTAEDNYQICTMLNSTSKGNENSSY